MLDFLLYNHGVTRSLAITIITKKKVGTGKFKKIVLHGIVVAGDVKEALLTDLSHKKPLHVEVEELYEDILIQTKRNEDE